MKTLKLLLITCCLICATTACEENHDLITEDSINALSSQAKSSKQLKLPYKAKMFTTAAEDAPSGTCTFNSPTDFWRPEHQIGKGNATYIGNFTTNLEFCFHIVLNDQGQPDFRAGFGEFTGASNIIEANNGDKLFTSGSGGKLMPIQDETYIFEFVNISLVKQCRIK